MTESDLVIDFEGVSITLPQRWHVGALASEHDASVFEVALVEEATLRACKRIRKAAKEHAIASSEAQEIFAECALATLRGEPAEPEVDPIFAEAMELARSAITSALAREGVHVMPPNLDDHARALVESNAELREHAAARVAAKQRIAREAIARLAPAAEPAQ